MDIKQNPFSLYDFLGYLTPGALFIYGWVTLHYHSKDAPDIIGNIHSAVSFDHPEVYVPLALVAYSLGHILSFVSSITVEKYAVWSLGYPSSFLFGGQPQGYFDVDKLVGLRRFIRFIVGLFLLPISMLDQLLAPFEVRELYAKPLAGIHAHIINKRIDELMRVRHPSMGDEIASEEDRNSTRFICVYHYAVGHAQNHLAKMQNYVALYGFLRTLTLLLVMAFWMLILHVHIYIGLGYYLYAVVGVAVPGILSVISYMAFVKFYRRFSVEAYMALMALDDSRTKDCKG